MLTGFRIVWRALVHFWDESLLLIRANVTWFVVSLPLYLLTVMVCALFIPGVDPESGEPLPDGEVGELILTAPTKEAFPALRYRTRDLAWLTRDACPCGRTGARISRILGRTDDMLIVRGVNVFPSQVEHALMGMSDLEPHY